MKITKGILDEKVNEYEKDVGHDLTFREIVMNREDYLGFPGANLDNMTDEELNKYDDYLCELMLKRRGLYMFKIGDRVRLRQGLKLGEDYNDITFLIGMKTSFEKNPIQRIEHVGKFCVRTSNCMFYMDSTMLELVDKKEIPNVEIIEKNNYKFIIAKPYVHCIDELENRHTFAYCLECDEFDKNKGMEIAKLKMDIIREEEKINELEELITFGKRRIKFMKDKLEGYQNEI